MAQLGSWKSILVLSLCLTLYVILSAIMLFYIENCLTGKTDTKKTAKAELLSNKCSAHLKPTTITKEAEEIHNFGNITAELCVRIMSDIYEPKLQDNGKTFCYFSSKSYLPCLHHLIFSLLTIGGTNAPITAPGQVMATIFTLCGLFPIIRLFIHTGVLISGRAEHVILSFEIKVLNRSPRMIHLLSKKVIFLQALVVVLYDVIVAKITSSAFFRTDWTYLESLHFWLLAMTTTGHEIDKAGSHVLYSNGGWRIIFIDVGVMIGMVFVSGLVCSIVQYLHKKSCHASNTIRQAFQRQKPEVYFEVKHLKSSL